MYCYRTKQHRNVYGGKLWPSQRKYGLCFFLATDRKKKGKERSNITKNESLIGACRNWVSAWLTSSWSFSLLWRSMFYELRLTTETDHLTEKSISKTQGNSSITLLSINILWLHFHRTNASNIDTVMLQSVPTLEEL